MRADDAWNRTRGTDATAERLASDRWPRVRQEYRAILQATAHSRAAWLFCAVLLIAVALLLVPSIFHVILDTIGGLI